MESFYYNTLAEGAPRQHHGQVLHEPQGRPDHDDQRQRLGDPEGLEEPRPRLQVHEGDDTSVDSVARRSPRSATTCASGRAARSPGLYTANTQADVKIYEDIYQPMGNKDFDDAVAAARRAPRGTASRCRSRPPAPSSSRPGWTRSTACSKGGRPRARRSTRPSGKLRPRSTRRRKNDAVGERRQQQHRATGPSRARRWLSGFRERETWTAYLFILPWVIGFLAADRGADAREPLLSRSPTTASSRSPASSRRTASASTTTGSCSNDPKVATSLKNTLHLHGDDGAGEDGRRARCSR